MLKDFVNQHLLTRSGKIISKKCNRRWFEKNDLIHIYDEINRSVDFVDSFTLKIRCLIDNITTHPICPVCNVHPVPVIKGRAFKRHCSKQCGDNNPNRIQKILKNTDYRKRAEKTKKTILEKYGVEHIFQSSQFKQQSKNTLFKKYGVTYVSQIPEIKQKKANTLKKNFPNGRGPSKHPNKINESVQKEIINLFLTEKKTPLELAHQFNLAFSTVYNIIHASGNGEELNGKSSYENEIYHFLVHSLGIEDIKRKCRSVIAPKELDFVIDNKTAIEFNGLYWHSELAGVPKSYHLEKTQLCQQQGLQLIHIFENEWLFKKDIVKSILRHRLNKTERKIFARECSIQEINCQTARTFFNENHIQGYIESSKYYGLFFGDELVSALSVGRSRFSKHYEYELKRFCNKLNTNVVGGASRLFKYFEKEQEPQSIVSYCDLRYFTGNHYKTLGFEEVNRTSPNYFYFKRSILESRNKYQKHRLSKKLETFDNNLTEAENMFNNGFNRIWDCGNIVYEKKYKYK